jgi:hypothetical protein
MKLSLITNNIELAQKAEDAGIERIMIDLETRGKAERQSGRKLFLSSHSIKDVKRIRKVLRMAQLMVRVDPLYTGSGKQIADVIDDGADLVMLPYFHSIDEAQEFLSEIRGNAAPVLLVETKAAVDILQELTTLPGLSEIHVGLNDLSISYGLNNFFNLVSNGTVDEICTILRNSKIPFGFGGIGSLERLDLPVPAELFLAEQVCQGATRGWLGRTFREVDLSLIETHIQSIRLAVNYWHQADNNEKQQLSTRLRAHISKIKNDFL